ncbi:hypothetical protein [Streptomyces pseudogriseolus]|uniref:Uncharacterized protein n=1 Tax=Streptomyces pseudogriseolus TaxID=36817 RepID=A0ABQ2TP34_STREZ|nr:hypothetical protein [Streptomyces rubiginosus]GGS76039.1 hypothetical protein GCM10010285_63210 [Streptomyces rubiginosus]
MRNLDDFAAALSQITAQAARAATTSTQTRTVIDAAASGGEDAVRRAVSGMSTTDLKRLKRQLEH